MASTAVNRRDEPSGLIFLVLLAASVVAHATLMSAMKLETPLAATRRSVEMAFFEEKRVETPKVEVVQPVLKTRPVTRVAKPRDDLPPPPAQEPVKRIAEPVVPIFGIAPDATGPNGKFAVPIGNSTIGPANKIVNEVKSYVGSKFASPGSADSEPTVVGEVKVDYPPDAKLNDVDGAVRLRVTTDERGVVTSVVVISGPGYGLNEAARDALKRFTFTPATKAGEPVGYTFTYIYRFELN
jgi:protein TonB